MYWDPELHSWRLVGAASDTSPAPKEPWADLPTDSDPPGNVCRPCTENAHGECEGPALCHCQLCQIAPHIHDLEQDWDWRDREKSWPT